MIINQLMPVQNSNFAMSAIMLISDINGYLQCIEQLTIDGTTLTIAYDMHITN